MQLVASGSCSAWASTHAPSRIFAAVHGSGRSKRITEAWLTPEALGDFPITVPSCRSRFISSTRLPAVEGRPCGFPSFRAWSIPAFTAPGCDITLSLRLVQKLGLVNSLVPSGDVLADLSGPGQALPAGRGSRRIKDRIVPSIQIGARHSL